jgi:alkylated DNA repair protein (DNA oxidative demethylase)
MQARLLEPQAGFLLPDGFVYQENFITSGEEAAVLDAIGRVEFHDIVMHGVTARRRSAHYGWKYDYGSWRLHPAPEMPSFLIPLRHLAAQFAGVEEQAFEHALINQYAPGAAIGWHRDSPPFGIIAGVSLGSECELRLRREGDSARDWVRIPATPRSVYLLSGPVRHDWQHSVPPVNARRYSVTFRTLVSPPAKP